MHNQTRSEERSHPLTNRRVGVSILFYFNHAPYTPAPTTLTRGTNPMSTTPPPRFARNEPNFPCSHTHSGLPHHQAKQQERSHECHTRRHQQSMGTKPSPYPRNEPNGPYILTSKEMERSHDHPTCTVTVKDRSQAHSGHTALLEERTQAHAHRTTALEERSQ